MKLTYDLVTGELTAEASTPAEAKDMEAFFLGTAKGQSFSYGGADIHPLWPSYITPSLKLNERSLPLIGTTQVDAGVGFGIRDLLFWGISVKVKLIDTTGEGDEFKANLFLAGVCTQCSQPCTTRSRAEWGICQNCVKACQHEWIAGVIRGGTSKDGKVIDLSAGEFCKICGAGKPGNKASGQALTLAEHHQLAVKSGKIAAIVSSPEELVQVINNLSGGAKNS